MTEDIRPIEALPKEASKKSSSNPIGDLFFRALTAQSTGLARREEIVRIKEGQGVKGEELGGMTTREYFSSRNAKFDKEEHDMANQIRLSILFLRDAIENPLKGRKLPVFIKINPKKSDSTSQDKDLYFITKEVKLVFAPTVESKKIGKEEMPDLTKAAPAPLTSWFHIGSLPSDMLNYLPGRTRRKILKDSKRQKA